MFVWKDHHTELDGHSKDGPELGLVVFDFSSSSILKHWPWIEIRVSSVTTDFRGYYSVDIGKLSDAYVLGQSFVLCSIFLSFLATCLELMITFGGILGAFFTTSLTMSAL